MANCLDYLDWRGDLTFEQSPLNEVDNYILCKLGCPDFTGIIPPDGAISLRDAVSQYNASLDGDDADDALGPLASPHIMPVINRLPETVRFGRLMVADFVNIVDMEIGEQFSALTIILPDGTRFVTFRGTGDTIISWKEDFLMGVEDMVPAQKDAAGYLMQESRRGAGKLVVGGHSKGGNLAVYASMKMPVEVQARITDIYNNDGPGFRRDLSDTPEYQRIKPMLHTLVSQHTTVGKLLYNEPDCTIVKSSQSGIAAHDGFNWEVMGTSFVRCDDFSFGSKAFESALEEVLDSMDNAQKRQFIQEFFTMLTSSGAQTLSDLTEKRLRSAAEFAAGMRTSPQVRGFLQKLSTIFIQETMASAKAAIPNIPKPRLLFGKGDKGDE